MSPSIQNATVASDVQDTKEECLSICDGEPLTLIPLAPILLEFGGSNHCLQHAVQQVHHVLFTLHRIISQGNYLAHGKGYSQSAFSWQYCFCVISRLDNAKYLKFCIVLLQWKHAMSSPWNIVLSSLLCCSCAYILTPSLSSLQSPTISQYLIV